MRDWFYVVEDSEINFVNFGKFEDIAKEKFIRYRYKGYKQ